MWLIFDGACLLPITYIGVSSVLVVCFIHVLIKSVDMKTVQMHYLFTNQLVSGDNLPII